MGSKVLRCLKRLGDTICHHLGMLTSSDRHEPRQCPRTSKRGMFSIFNILQVMSCYCLTNWESALHILISNPNYVHRNPPGLTYMCVYTHKHACQLVRAHTDACWEVLQKAKLSLRPDKCSGDSYWSEIIPRGGFRSAGSLAWRPNIAENRSEILILSFVYDLNSNS